MRSARCVGSLFLVFGIVAAFCGCGGSGGGAVPSRALNQIANDGSSKILLSQAAITAQLPPAGGFGGAVTFPAVSANTAINVTSSTAVPAALLAPQSVRRRAQTGSLSIFYYVTFVPQTTITLPSLPRMQLKLPLTFATANQQFYYAIQQPAPPGVSLEFLTEGPGTAKGQLVTFSASLTPLTLQAGHSYVFGFYAVSTSVSAAADLLYVANSGANSITAYPISAQGNTAPARALAGPNTGLSSPQAVALDSDGNFVVANATLSGGLIEIFAHAASGNARPIKSFAVPALPTAIAIDPSSADIYVGLEDGASSGSGVPSVAVYSPSGSLLRTVSNFSGTTETPPPGQDIPNGIGPLHLVLDNKDELIVEVFLEDRQFFDHTVQVFAPHAAGNDSAINSVSLCFTFGGCTLGAGIAYASGIDHVFTPSPLAEFINGSFSIVRQVGSDFSLVPVGLAVTAAGADVFVTDGSATVYHYIDAGTGFLNRSSLVGNSTGLAQPSALAIGIP